MKQAFQPFVGQHCETVATGTLLQGCGIRLSEPMLFGLGEGLGFIMLNLRTLPLPFVGGRTRPFALTTALCRNLGVTLKARETSSKATAWKTLAASLDGGQSVGLQLDCFHLPYFSHPIRFAGHFVAAHAYDDRDVLLVDTEPQGTLQRAPRKSVEAARFAKGPMAARARSWTVTVSRKAVPLARALRAAIRATAANYLEPPFSGASYRGIEKLATSLPAWRRQAKQPARDLVLAATLMERAGTGGALFRNFYRDFLREARDHLPGARAALDKGQVLFAESAENWTRVAQLIGRAARGSDEPLQAASESCRRIAVLEQDAMRALARV